jgi:hypothetical protein
MDRASAKLSRARSALNVAMMAGMEAKRGELLDMIETALEKLEEAETELRCGENQNVLPGQLIPAEDLTPCQTVVLVAASNKAL